MVDGHAPETEAPAEPSDCAAVLSDLVDLVENAKSMPLSASAIISREEVLGLLGDAQAALPIEIQRGRRLLSEREEVRAAAMREAGEVLGEARAQAAYMVQRTEVVRQARVQAERILAEAETEARRVRHDADDYVDRKLAGFEIVLDRTMRTVQSGREALSTAVVGDDSDLAIATPGEEGEEDGFFDQDLS